LDYDETVKDVNGGVHDDFETSKRRPHRDDAADVEKTTSTTSIESL